MSQSIIDIAQDLITIESTADKPENLQKIIEYVQNYFTDSSNLITKIYESKGKKSIVVSTQEGLEFDIIMSGHLDVVHAPTKMFTPKIENGKLLGRGACDMKAEVAMMMKVLKDISQTESYPSIALMLTTDEEIGGANGTRYLVDDIGYKGSTILIPDSGKKLNELLTTNKGVMLTKLTTTGKNAHGSQPWDGINAIDKLLEDVNTLQGLEIFEKNDSPNHWYCSCTLSSISGGSSPNQIPHEAECTLDIRYTEKINRTDLEQLIKENIKHASYKILAEGSLRHTDIDHPTTKKYMEAMKEISGKEIEFTQSHGANDGRFFGAHNMLTLVSRPLSDGEHTDDEWMNIESLEKLYQIYIKFLTNLA